MVSEQAFQRALFDVSALLFATSAAVTIDVLHLDKGYRGPPTRLPRE
jgi:hypothetical protein